MTKCVKRCFTVSVVLNVLLFGVLGGHFFMMWQDHPWWEIKEELAPETQNYVAATFQNAFRDIREVGDEARKTRADLVKILSAEKFDEKAFDKQIKKLAVTRNKIAAIKIKATKEMAQKLSQPEREKMADRMAKMVGGGWERRVERDHKPREMDKSAPPPKD
jgi:uncharacterized membrane protein